MGLSERFKKLGIREQDLREHFVRSRGRGGQNVNKVSTCVILVHGPSGITIRCESERTQNRNRMVARERLADKLESQILSRKKDKQKAIEKLRRQKRRRPKKLKEKILKAKKHRSKLKHLRRHPTLND